MTRLDAGFFDRPVLEVAPELLGCVVTHAGVGVRLTEVEAYDGSNDPGSHAFRGETPRTRVMFGPPGGLYVYFTYGMHHCANLVCGEDGRASAVLLRAGEVVTGIDLARERRTAGRSTRLADRDLARGPARLVQALGITSGDDGVRTTDPAAPVTVVRGDPVDAAQVRTGPRVGVSGDGGDGGRFPWRFWIDGDPTVSAYRPAKPRRRPARR
ncbi:DNA-3-methyladenine glycosylase [Barrientosiimonas humi]|uniref:Putative 3-methyladenine DNA glycosylase n=1 Tax=Barrientosiimonas humi TaxID=999931 RepID=A0A542XC70_9MICO|nr:DNA-3-methyladenine glycosylase [Barrientosiimonas humi]TQL33432.1 DNA-3-methyladenine glycosylase [Barrientosiimonas humi]CAG7573420.1 Putative 3-methyladenine DNA glycosylase [Barrientosiimonas humi]